MNFYKITGSLFKRLLKYSVYQKNKHHFISRSKKIVKECKCKPLSRSQKKQIKEYYARFGFKNINTRWHQFYTDLRGEFHKEYIPVELYTNVIEPQLNMLSEPEILTDKNLLDRLFNAIEQPETIVKNINGIFLDENRNILDFDQVINKCLEYKKLIIKPSLDSGGGKNIIVFELNGKQSNYEKLSIEELISLYDKNFIIQKYFIQHKTMSDLNKSSVNTLRIQSLLIDCEVMILASFVRIGGEGAVVDNSSHPTSGKSVIVCNVKEDGTLDKGYRGDGKIVTESNTNIKLENYQIPNYSNIKIAVKNLHKQIPYFRIVSWDIAINEKGRPVLIEFNVSVQGVHHQFATGTLFGEYTDKILAQCTVNMFSN
ncbi:sugar-transfer associated ATP-grasp domain-containing protein [Aureibaculum sp. 2210JD6-5]|uniref:sugar-transfer associated ATP-grasp domain-containing protein n=1 Tax=Aureibaculum sp. 2210JD6-5 TaxID=3103957 RepID=UPI002AAEB904|nr:sugar-transfer associated ATP-grasp domain-containing protein [Aureibaculum sp. 2210JD6-5]MDY7394090.1 sugar-transfer associated ATP-grasp domain-containing protein [Aureibaculum sp. 2210JD6-5]